MNHLRSQQLISSYGADPARWPEAERVTAEQLMAALAHDAELAAVFADATAVDIALSTVDRDGAAVDALRTERLLRAVQARVQALPQLTQFVQHEPDEAPAPADKAQAALSVAATLRKQRSFPLAWAAMLPLLFGFLAGAMSGAGGTHELLQTTLAQSVGGEFDSVDASYADEAMMAPFVVAAEFAGESGAHDL